MVADAEERESSLDRLTLLYAKVQMCIAEDAASPSDQTAERLIEAWERYRLERARHPGWRDLHKRRTDTS